MRTLLVDDSIEMRQLVGRVLRRRGHDVVEFGNAEDALEAYRRERFPLVLLDWFLPGMDGLQLCRSMRALPDGDRSVIVVITAKDRLDELEAVLDAGASDYLSKPFGIGLLQVRLAIAERQVDEIAARKSAEEALQRLANSDPLTNVANRRRATERLNEMFSLGRRRGEPVALAILDIDYFKRVNDTSGHAMGDEVLRAIGSMLSRSFRSEDVVGRWGGEEFVVGFYGTPRSGLVRRLDKLRATLKEHMFQGDSGEPFAITFSAGVAAFPIDGSDIESLLRAADSALYRAKAAGRDQVLEAS